MTRPQRPDEVNYEIMLDGASVTGPAPAVRRDRLWHEQLLTASRSLAWSVWWWGVAALLATCAGVAVFQLLQHGSEIAARIIAPAE